MIIFGSRMYGVKHEVWGYGECENCGAYGKHRSYQGRRFGHLYFIPLIPMGGAVRVMKECASCKTGRQVPIDQVDALYRRIEELMQPCVLAAEEGEHSFIDEEGVDVHNGPFLLEAIDLMYTAGYHGEIPELLNLLDKDVSRYEHGVASGAYAELCGDSQAAYQAYQSACEARPDEVLPYVLLSDAQRRGGQAEAALGLLDRALEIEPDNVQLLLAKAGPLEALGRYGELTELLDRAVQVEPALQQNKQITKLRKKYAKRAAKQR
jgi:tetratricopeptide (TPR) repeat protein